MINTDYNRFITTTDINGKMMLYRSYAQWQHNFGGRFTTYTGIHIQYFGLNNELAAEPRLGSPTGLHQKREHSILDSVFTASFSPK